MDTCCAAAHKTETYLSQQERNPLADQLKGINHAHPYIASRGITQETAEYFGVGFFPGEGSMSGRVVIPIHNERGDLVTYAGRAIDGSEPKYRLSAKFERSQTLFHLFKAWDFWESSLEVSGVVVVEGFFDCMKVWQAGHLCVALMGCSMSEEQERLLSRFQKVALLLDGNATGREAVARIVQRLTQTVYVKTPALDQRCNLDHMSHQDISELLSLNV